MREAKRGRETSEKSTEERDQLLCQADAVQQVLKTRLAAQLIVEVRALAFEGRSGVFRVGSSQQGNRLIHPPQSDVRHYGRRRRGQEKALIPGAPIIDISRRTHQ